ncbi:unnamed protein product [Lactuca virosa]|uniref:RRM domain-containing protein n=1 Tax=Lactuca virosa TaxID=75947 RepID=A0AAU9PV26_9ASTR|nr:unnamed protein product [Lactuca virosa]
MSRRRFRQGMVSKALDKDVEDVATSFFISNIPDECNDLYLRKVFQKLGCLVDVYVAQKRVPLGLRFSFARFIKVHNEIFMEKKLSEVVVMGQYLKVNISKFKRNKPITNKVECNVDRRSFIHISNDVKKTGGFKSYVEAMKDMKGVKEDFGDCQASKLSLLCIPDGVSPRPHSWIEGCMIGEAKDLNFLSKFFEIFCSSDLVDCSLKYLGGLNVLLDFGRSVAGIILKDDVEGWRAWFSWLKVWDDSFV